MTPVSLRGDADVRRFPVVEIDDAPATAEVVTGPGSGMTQLNPNEAARLVLADLPALPRIRVARPRARRAAPCRRRGPQRITTTAAVESESPAPPTPPRDTLALRSPLAPIGGVR